MSPPGIQRMVLNLARDALSVLAARVAGPEADERALARHEEELSG